MKKKLPYIAIEGVGNTPEERLQSLIEIEPVLVMLGYNDSDERWNNWYVDTLQEYDVSYILAYGYNIVGYHNHNGTDVLAKFKSTDLKAIINYVENYKE